MSALSVLQHKSTPEILYENPELFTLVAAIRRHSRWFSLTATLALISSSILGSHGTNLLLV